MKLEPVFYVDADSNVRILSAVDLHVYCGHIDAFFKDNVPYVPQEKGTIVGVNVHTSWVGFACSSPLYQNQPGLILFEVVEKAFAVAAVNLDHVAGVDDIANNVFARLWLAAGSEAFLHAPGSSDWYL